MRMMNKSAWAALLAITVAGGLPGGAARAEATAGPSDELVTAVMNYAWAMLPAQFSNKDGNVIVVDKNKKAEVMVPMDVAREVVRVARVSAHAQVCNLPDDQSLNHRSLMKREVDKKTWTDQQKLWINQLHLTTVMVLTGKIKAVETEGGKEVAVVEGKEPPNTCTDEQKQAVKDKIKGYVDAGPALAVQPVAVPAATGANPAAAAPAKAAAAPAAPATKPAAPAPTAAATPPAVTEKK